MCLERKCQKLHVSENRKSSFMSALCEGGSWRECGPVSGPFARNELVGVVHCSVLSCRTEATANGPSVASSVVEARFGPIGNFVLGYEAVESVSYFSNGPERLASVRWICIATRSREVCERCFALCESLRSVIFGSSSNLERICSEAFFGTSIEWLTIPNSVVEIGQKCFYECKSLRSLRFGASSNLERICSEAFSNVGS